MKNKINADIMLSHSSFFILHSSFFILHSLFFIYFQFQQKSCSIGIIRVNHYYAAKFLGNDTANIQTEAGALMEAVEL